MANVNHTANGSREERGSTLPSDFQKMLKQELGEMQDKMDARIATLMNKQEMDMLNHSLQVAQLQNQIQQLLILQQQQLLQQQQQGQFIGIGSGGSILQMQPLVNAAQQAHDPTCKSMDTSDTSNTTASGTPAATDIATTVPPQPVTSGFVHKTVAVQDLGYEDVMDPNVIASHEVEVDTAKSRLQSRMSGLVRRGSMNQSASFRSTDHQHNRGDEEERSVQEAPEPVRRTSSNQRISRQGRIRRSRSFESADTGDTSYYTSGDTSKEDVGVDSVAVNADLGKVANDDHQDVHKTKEDKGAQKAEVSAINPTSPTKKRGSKKSLGGFFKRCETHELVKEHKHRSPSVLLELDFEDESLVQMEKPTSIGEQDSVSSDISDASSEASFGIPELVEESQEDSTDRAAPNHEDLPKDHCGHNLEPKRISTGCKGFPDRGASFSNGTSNGAFEKSFVLPGLEHRQEDKRMGAKDPTTECSKPLTNTAPTLRKQKGPPRKCASFNNYSFSYLGNRSTAAVTAARTMRAQPRLAGSNKQHNSLSNVHAGHVVPDKELKKEVSFTLRRRQLPQRSKSLDESVSSISRLELSLSSHGTTTIGGNSSYGNISNRSRPHRVQRHSSMSHVERTIHVANHHEEGFRTSSNPRSQFADQRGNILSCLHSTSAECPTCVGSKKGQGKKTKRGIRRCKSGGHSTTISRLHHSFHVSSGTNDQALRISSASSHDDDIRSRALALLDFIGPDDDDDETNWPDSPEHEDASSISASDLGYEDACPDSDMTAPRHDSVQSKSGHNSIQKLSASYGYLSPMPHHRSRSMDLLQASKMRQPPRRAKSTVSTTAPPKPAAPNSLDDDLDASLSTTCSRSSIASTSSRRKGNASRSSWGNASFRKNMMSDRKELDTSSFVTGSRIRRIENVEQFHLGLSVSRHNNSRSNS